MSEVRMSLHEAAEILGIAPNSVRSRWKSGKIRGERDNVGKIWVYLNTEKAANDEGSKEGISKPSKKVSKASIEGSIEPSNTGEINALQDHVKTLNEQLAIAQSELLALRPIAIENARLTAENQGLQTLLDMRADQLDELRRLLSEAKENHAEELKRWMAEQPAKGFFARLFSSK